PSQLEAAGIDLLMFDIESGITTTPIPIAEEVEDRSPGSLVHVVTDTDMNNTGRSKEGDEEVHSLTDGLPYLSDEESMDPTSKTPAHQDERVTDDGPNDDGEKEKRKKRRKKKKEKEKRRKRRRREKTVTDETEHEANTDGT
ncbi:hypothetical protein ADUPG1_003495, partial [Aduncisulcus paluster]